MITKTTHAPRPARTETFAGEVRYIPAGTAEFTLHYSGECPLKISSEIESPIKDDFGNLHIFKGIGYVTEIHVNIDSEFQNSMAKIQVTGY